MKSSVSLTIHLPCRFGTDFMGLTTFCNSRRYNWGRRPLCCVSVGHQHPQRDTCGFLLKCLGISRLPKLSITQLQPRIHFRSPFQSFPCPGDPFGLGLPLGFCFVLRTSPLPATHEKHGNRCDTHQSSLDALLSCNIVSHIPDGLEPSFSGCKPGVVATGPRDLLRNAIAIAFERLTMTDELLFKIGANLWQSVKGGQLLLEHSQHLRLRFMSSRILISEIAVSMKCKAST